MRLVYTLGVLALSGLLAGPALAITAGQLDDFEDETLAGWFSNNGTNVAGGPAGSEDRFLQVTATGTGGANSRLVTFNQAQWSGDYLAAGVVGVELALRNLGVTPLQMRLAIGDSSAPNSGGTWFSSTLGLLLPEDEDWGTYYLSLAEADLTRVQGTANHADVMANLVTLRILHSLSPASRGDRIAGEFGADSIRAVPEPATLILLAAAALLLPRLRP